MFGVEGSHDALFRILYIFSDGQLIFHTSFSEEISTSLSLRKNHEGNSPLRFVEILNFSKGNNDSFLISANLAGIISCEYFLSEGSHHQNFCWRCNFNDEFLQHLNSFETDIRDDESLPLKNDIFFNDICCGEVSFDFKDASSSSNYFILVVDNQRYLHFLNDGFILDSILLSSEASCVCLADAKIYLGCKDGFIYSLDQNFRSVSLFDVGFYISKLYSFPHPNSTNANHSSLLFCIGHFSSIKIFHNSKVFFFWFFFIHASIDR
eukprot:Sdes_comp20571_c0_seq1m15449